MISAFRRIFQFLILTIGALLMATPFLWMIITSLNTSVQTLTAPSNIFASTFSFENYITIWHLAPFMRYFFNSILVTVLTTIGQLLTGILAAFAFTHLKFYGRQILFRGLILLMMIPGELLLVPNFVTLTHLHLIDTYGALIIPWLISIFTIFTLRQAFESTSKTSFYAARLDGASNWQYLWQILVPANSTVIIAVTILQVVGSWNSFMWPLIMLNSDQLRTLPVGLMNLTSDLGTNYPLLMAATTCTMAPMILIYLCLQKYITDGIINAKSKG